MNSGTESSVVDLKNYYPDSDQNEVIQKELERKTRYGYQIGNFHFVLRESVIPELLINPDIYPMPLSPSWMVGLINVRGNIVPVLDISEKIIGRIGRQDKQHVLLINKSAGAVAILIDFIPEAISIDMSPSDSIAEIAGMEQFTNGAYFSEKGIWYEFDVESYCHDLKKAG